MTGTDVVCVCVCLCVKYLKKLLTDLDQILELRPSTSRLDFGIDPDPSLDTGWVFHFSTWKDRVF